MNILLVKYHLKFGGKTNPLKVQNKFVDPILGYQRYYHYFVMASYADFLLVIIQNNLDMEGLDFDQY